MNAKSMLPVTFTLTLAACSGGVDEPENPVANARETRFGRHYDRKSADEYQVELLQTRFSDRCLHTGDQACTACEVALATKVSACHRLCSDVAISGGPVVGCLGTCERIAASTSCDFTCDFQKDTCYQREFVFEPIGPSDEAILRSCRADQKRDTECDEQGPELQCELYAKVEKPPVAKVYQCGADLECGAAHAPCLDGVEPLDLLSEIQVECSDTLRSGTTDNINAVAGWLRAEVLQDVNICAELYCGDYRYADCVEAWFTGVSGFE